MSDEIVRNLGPLAALAGVWEGEKGHDIAPSDDRGTEENRFRERLSFVPFGPVNNHEQTLWGLKYSTMAWRLGEENSFHEEVGYWLWDPKEKQVLRSFMIPRGVTVLAGGTVEPSAKSFQLSAEAGSHTYGICSNQFLEREFKTVRYELKITIHGHESFSYEEHSWLQMAGRKEPFDHSDANTVRRVSKVGVKQSETVSGAV